MLEEFIDIVLREIRSTRSAIESDMGKGAPRTYEDFRFLVGKIRGLNDVEQFIRDTYSKLNQQEEAEIGND